MSSFEIDIKNNITHNIEIKPSYYYADSYVFKFSHDCTMNKNIFDKLNIETAYPILNFEIFVYERNEDNEKKIKSSDKHIMYTDINIKTYYTYHEHTVENITIDHMYIDNDINNEVDLDNILYDIESVFDFMDNDLFVNTIFQEAFESIKYHITNELSKTIKNNIY